MDPYAKPSERKVGEHRPRIEHVAPEETRKKNRQERQAEKQQIVAERRAIKQSARRHLHRLLESDLEETGSE